MSSYLTFRFVVRDNQFWKYNVRPVLPSVKKKDQIDVETSVDVYKALKNIINWDKKTGILLSSGIDSAILASFLPEGAKAYTIKFIDDFAIDESILASIYAKKWKLQHKIIEVTWQDYLRYMDLLMKNKKSPLHPIEVALFKASMIVKTDGINELITGCNADGIFGGMDKLLSKDWTLNDFIKRYTFIEPEIVLHNPISMKDIYEEFLFQNKLDVQKFLKVIFGRDTLGAFTNGITSAGCYIISPYSYLNLTIPLDLDRIRKGETKYILREIFNQLYPEIEIPDKIAFARPMDQWLSYWEGPNRVEFLDNIDINQFTGNQKWLIYCLDRFMHLFNND